MERVFFQSYPDGAVVFADIVDDRVVIQAEAPFATDNPDDQVVHSDVEVVALSEWNIMLPSLRESHYRNLLQKVRQNAVFDYYQQHPMTCEELKRQSRITATCCHICHAEIDSGTLLQHEFPYLPYGQLTNVCCRIEQTRLHFRDEPMTDEELAEITHRLDASSSEPWKADRQGEHWRVYSEPERSMYLLMREAEDEDQAKDNATICDNISSSGNAEVIANARSDIHTLIAEIDRLREEVRRLREQQTDDEAFNQ